MGGKTRSWSWGAVESSLPITTHKHFQQRFENISRPDFGYNYTVCAGNQSEAKGLLDCSPIAWRQLVQRVDLIRGANGEQEREIMRLAFHRRCPCVC